MPREIVRGLRSTHGDQYQLNTTTFLRHSVRTFPEQEIVFRTPDGGWDRYSYADMYERVVSMANALRGLGVTPGDVVGVLDWNHRRFYEAYWAIPGLAAVLLQMNLRLGSEDLAFVTTHSKASVVLVDESLLGVAESIAPTTPHVTTWVLMSDRPVADIETSLPNLVHLEDLMSESSSEIDWPTIDESSAYSACYTTGTTGRPKGVYYSHRGIYLHSMAQAASLSMRSDDCVMLTTPMFHGQCWGLPQSAMYSAAKLVLPGRYTADDTSVLVDAMINERVTVSNGAPAIFQPMIDYIKTLDTAPDLSRARLLSGATEPAVSLMRDFKEITGAEIIQVYGATETTPLVTVNFGAKPTLSLSADEFWNIKRSQGLPVNGVDIRIVDQDDNDLPADGRSQGEVLVRGPWVIERYHDLEDQDERFVDGFWRTGDVGALFPNGYLKLTDRIKDVIKSGGEWISSIDMENAIMAHPRVVECAVVGVAHPRWQERPLVLVVTIDGKDLPLSDIHNLLEGSFAKWQLPETVLLLEALPRTSVGKLDKKSMRATYGSIYTS